MNKYTVCYKGESVEAALTVFAEDFDRREGDYVFWCYPEHASRVGMRDEVLTVPSANVRFIRKEMDDE